MLLRYNLEGNMDWVCRTHITVPLAGTTWTLAMILPTAFTDEQIKDLMLIPEELNDVTTLHQGISVPDNRIIIPKSEDWLERRRAYQREWCRRKKERNRS